MTKQLLLSITIFLTTFNILRASNNVNGYVSGIWHKIDSPFIVDGNITVHADSQLVIEPGVQVLFKANQDFPITFFIYGKLTAIGTETDSIFFNSNRSVPISGDWNGLQFINCKDTSIVQYTKVANATKGIYALAKQNNIALKFENSHICLNKSNGILVEGRAYDASSCIIKNSKISNNGDSGIKCHGASDGNTAGDIVPGKSNPLISNNIILNNIGHGIECYGEIDKATGYSGTPPHPDSAFASPIIQNNIISFNKGSGIYCEGYGWSFSFFGMTSIGKGFSCPIIINNIVYENEKNGLCCKSTDELDYTNPKIFNNTFWGNKSISVKFGSYIDSSQCKFINNIVASSDTGLFKPDNDYVVVSHNCIYTNVTSFQGFNSDFGELIQSNINGTPCDKFYNIYINPELENPAEQIFSLSNNSPCIDAGFDLGYSYFGTSPDIGAIESNNSTFVNDDFVHPTSFNLKQNYPNPFNPVTNIIFSNPKKQRTKIEIYNMLGQKVATLIDETIDAGIHNITWNSLNFPSGIYVYQLITESTTLSKKMLLVK